MQNIDAYKYLISRFIELAEKHRIPITPMLGRRHGVSEMGSPPYMEVFVDRWFSIDHEQGLLDLQWNGLDPPHLDVFADLQIYPVDLLWDMRCAWFNFDVEPKQAELAVRELAHRAARASS